MATIVIIFIYFIVKQMELLIDGIKNNGFDKMKNEVERKTKIKQEFEKNIERLKNSMKANSDHAVDTQCKTTKLQLENNFMFTNGGVII